MSFAISGDSMRETENGLEVTIRVAAGSSVEFASELGSFAQPLDTNFLLSYLTRQYKGDFINRVHLVQAGRRIGTLSVMSLLADSSSSQARE